MTRASWRSVMDGEGPAYRSFANKTTDPAQIGERPALLVIDVVTAFLGRQGQTMEESVQQYPLSCGPAGWAALPQVKSLIEFARRQGFPVIYTTGDRERLLGGALRSVIDSRRSAGDEVAEIPSEIAPEPDEVVLSKSRASAFFGTVLTPLLHQRRADSLIITGTTTSGCIRATVVDGHSLGWPVAVADDACFDRARLSHDVNLFEMNAKYATVASSADIIRAFEQKSAALA